LATYTCLFAMTDRAIGDVKISPGALLVVYDPVIASKGNTINASSSAVLPIKILGLEAGGDGDILHERELALEPSAASSTASTVSATPPQAPIEFVEHSCGKILFKQTGHPLKILDLHTSKEIAVHQFVAPNSFIFLDKIRRFLIFRGHTVTLFNFRGERVSTFEDHMLWLPDSNMNNVFISSAQDVMISFCRNTDIGSMPGSINVSSIKTGKLLAKVAANATTGLEAAVEGRLDSWEEERGDEEEEQLDLGGGVAIERSLLVSNLSAVAEQIMAQAGVTRQGGPGSGNGADAIGDDGFDVSNAAEAEVALAVLAGGANRRRTAEDRMREEDRQAGLRKVTCIAYDEVNCEILTGNALGQIMVWGH
jgi:hypothetical protein